VLGPDGDVLDITGQSAARQLHRALGRPFRYRTETVEQAFTDRLKLAGTPSDEPRLDDSVSW
jgi:hypothetical protein